MPIYNKAFDVVVDDFGNPKFTQLGKKVFVSVYPGGADLGVSKPPAHTFRLQGSPFGNNLIKRPFTGGKSVVNLNVANNSSIAGTTLTINGVVYTLVANGSTPTTYQIEAGADAAGTEANIIAKLNNLQVTKRTKLTAVDNSGVVKVTGSDKEALTITSSDTNKITSSAGTGTAASLKVDFGDDIFVPGTLNVFRIGLKTTDALGVTKDDKVRIATLTPAGTTTRTQLIAAVKAVFTKALAGNAPFDADGISYLGYVDSENGRTYAEISTALQAVFGSNIDNTFTSNSTSFTLTVVQSAYLGLPGDGLQVEFVIFATEPDCEIIIDENKTVTVNGVAGTKIHSSRDYNSKSDIATATIPQDNEDVDYTENKTSISGTVSFSCNDVHRAEIDAMLASSARSANLTHDIVMDGGGSGLPVLGVAALIETDVAGKYHFELSNIYATGGKDFKGGKGSTDPTVISGKVIPIPGVANVGIMRYKLARASQS